MTRRKEASKKHSSKRLIKRMFSKGLSAFLTIITTFFGAIIAFSYNERPIVYFYAKVPETFRLDQEPFCFLIFVWNTGGMNAWVDILIRIRSFSRSPLIPFLEEYYLTFVRVSVLLVGRARNYTMIPICIDLQRTLDKHDVTIAIKIRFTLNTIFREEHALSPTSFRYEKQGSSEYLLSWRD